MHSDSKKNSWDISRRAFMAASAAAAGIPMAGVAVPGAAGQAARNAKPAVVHCAFLYPPTATLDEAGYYSWPGSGFKAEERQKTYEQRLREIADRLGVQLKFAQKLIDQAGDGEAFVKEVKAVKPDGVLLVVFKKGHWARAEEIRAAVSAPVVVNATLGTLLVDQINKADATAGLHLIHALDDFGAMEYGLRMIRTRRRMKDAVLIDLSPNEAGETPVPFLGTTVRTVPLERFYEAFAKVEATDQVKALAQRYKSGAKKVVEPSDADILEAAKCCFALKSLVAAEQANALMMTCLPGLQAPHKHVPPCMGFMSLRDEGIVAGCQSDLNATLSLMLVQELFGRPGFQQNASMNTEKNLYFGAHCTCPTRLRGAGGKPEPYILRNHAEAGWGCVPRVLFTPGEDVTLTQYVSGEKPEMYVYTGKVASCPECPPAGGCRTNIEMSVNEVDDVRDVKGMHQTICYGNYGRQLRAFCRLVGIKATPAV